MQYSLPFRRMPDFDGETYERTHDHARLGSQLRAVLAVMLDHRWHTLDELSRRIPGASVPGLSARVRDLRKPKFGGYEIERRRRGSPADGMFEYRLVDPNERAG